MGLYKLPGAIRLRVAAGADVLAETSSASAVAVDLTGRFAVQLPSQIQAVQPDLFGGYDTAGGITQAVLFNPASSLRTDLNSIFFGPKVLALCPGYQAGLA
jgi:hypothetical protein